VFLEGLRYKGEVEVNVAGVWEPGHPEPLWIITDLDPKEADHVPSSGVKKGSFWSSSYPVSTSSTASTGFPAHFASRRGLP